jgi:hypothetical protein
MDTVLAEDLSEQFGNPVNTVRMRWQLSHLVDQVSIDQLEALAREQAEFEHVFDLVAREPLARKCGG